MEETVITAIRDHPGLPRRDLWTTILVSHFMRFRRREFGDELKGLRKAGRIAILSATGQINDDTRIWLAGAKPAVLPGTPPTSIRPALSTRHAVR